MRTISTNYKQFSLDILKAKENKKMFYFLTTQKHKNKPTKKKRNIIIFNYIQFL